MPPFDPNKNRKNTAKHGRPLSFAFEVFADPHLVEVIDDSMNYSETRWNAMGLVAGTVYVVTYTEREDGPRIISLREADRRETDRYFRCADEGVWS